MQSSSTCTVVEIILIERYNFKIQTEIMRGIYKKVHARLLAWVLPESEKLDARHMNECVLLMQDM